MESSESVAVAAVAPPPADRPELRAQAILAEMDCGDLKRRNAAIVTLAGADAATSAIVEAAAARAVADWEGEEEDWSDWRALDSEPFHFLDEDAEEKS